VLCWYFLCCHDLALVVSSAVWLRPRAALESFVLLLAPYAPHLAEELWSRLGHQSTLAYEHWPQADEALLVVDSVKLPVQVDSNVLCSLLANVCMQHMLE
jgi:leucyl-tRNA synthetase